MREIDISEVVGIWFHDVRVSRVKIDYVRREVELDCVIPVGWWNSDNPEGQVGKERRGALLFTGLQYLVVEPPDSRYPYEDSEGIEITDAGLVTLEKFDLSRLPTDLPEDAFIQYFFVNEWNACILVAATGASFQ